MLAPRLLVFDLDGTLVDSRKDLAVSVNAMLAEHGVGPLPEERVGRMVGEGARVLVERALDACALPRGGISHALERFLAVYDGHLLDHTRAYPGIPELLEELHAKADLAVLTNKPTRATIRILDGLNLARYFRVVTGGDGALGRKPNPDALLHIVRTCGATRETTVMVGDSRIDLETASNAGVRCCLVRYGFGFSFEAGEIGDKVIVADTPAAIATVF